MRSARPFTSPLPTATAIVVAVLVAMASTLADTGLGAVQTENPAGRVPSSLVVSSRALATALASVAERLEEDWSSHRRPTPTGSSGLSGLALAARWHGASRDLPFATQLTSPGGHRHRVDEIPTLDERRATLRRLVNLPPPLLA